MCASFVVDDFLLTLYLCSFWNKCDSILSGLDNVRLLQQTLEPLLLDVQYVCKVRQGWMDGGGSGWVGWAAACDQGFDLHLKVLHLLANMMQGKSGL